jgi:hypothetical protein
MVHLRRPANESSHGRNLGILIIGCKVREMLGDGFVLVQGKGEEAAVYFLGFWVCFYDELGDDYKTYPTTS